MRAERRMDSKADGLSILLLEDDDADAYLTARALLSIPGVDHVVRARDGQEAVSKLKAAEVTPDIGFIDLKMPVMDGLSFMNTCMNEGLANIPLIVLTSSSDWKDALRSRVNGAMRVITKSENPSDLRSSLKEAIDVFVPGGLARTVSQIWQPPQTIRSDDQVRPDRTTPVSASTTFGRREPRTTS